jgi:uncharacterized phiE125 gp8 family phage protein
MRPLTWAVEIIANTVAGVIATEDAKTHLRVSGSDEDDLIDRLIVAAITSVEAHARIAMTPQTLELRVPRFPLGGGYFALPRSPVRSVTSITYIDTDGDEQTLAGTVYALEGSGRPATVFLADDAQCWPGDAADRRDAVRVRYEAGPSTVGNVPEDLISAAMLLIGHLYENRQSVVIGTIASKVPDAVGTLIMRHKIPNGELGVVDV